MTSLHSLPNELLYVISSQLSPTNQLAFKCTSRHFYLSLPAIKPPKALTKCSSLFAKSILAFDRDRRMCALCKTYFPASLFDDNQANPTSKETENAFSKRMLDDGFGPLGGPGMLTAPDGCCSWHRADLWSVHLFTRMIVRHPLLPDWISSPDSMCMHCGKFKGDVEGCVCAIDHSGEMVCGCGFKTVRRYVRITFSSPWVGEGELYGDCGRILFFKRDGAMFVREWRGLDSARDIMVAARRLGYDVGRDRFGGWVDYPVEERRLDWW